MSDDKKKKKNDEKKAKPRVKPMSKTKTIGRVPTNSPSHLSISRQPSSISPNSSSDGYIQDGRPTNTNQPPMMQMKIDPNSNPGPLAARALEQLDPRISNASSGHNLISLTPATNMPSPRPSPHSFVAPNTTQQSRATIPVLPSANRTFPDSGVRYTLPDSSQGLLPPNSFPVPSSSPSSASSPSSRDVLPVIDLPDQRPTADIMTSQSFGAYNRTPGSTSNADNISLSSRVSRNVDESRLAADLIPMDDPQREQKLKCCRHYLRVRYLSFNVPNGLYGLLKVRTQQIQREPADIPDEQKGHRLPYTDKFGVMHAEPLPPDSETQKKAEAEQLRRLHEFGKQKKQLDEEMRAFSENPKRSPPAFVTQWVSRYGPPEALRPMLYHACLGVGDFAYINDPGRSSAPRSSAPSPTPSSAASLSLSASAARSSGPANGPGPTPTPTPTYATASATGARSGKQLAQSQAGAGHMLSYSVVAKKLAKRTEHLRRDQTPHDLQVNAFEHFWREGVSRLSLATLEQIDKDINRAFRHHEKFVDRYGEGYPLLFSSLRAQSEASNPN